jgi:putative FmdB family regulatory protein
MPMYEYVCEHCGHKFDVIKKFSDPVEEACPNCGEAHTHRLMGKPSFRFKGSGFYVNDYGHGHSSAGGKAESSPSASSSASTESCGSCCNGSCPSNPHTH